MAQKWHDYENIIKDRRPNLVVVSSESVEMDRLKSILVFCESVGVEVKISSKFYENMILR